MTTTTRASADNLAASTVWALAWENATSGASAWRRSRTDAEALFADWCALQGPGDTFALWEATVPAEASRDVITQIVDTQMWTRDYKPLRRVVAAVTT